MHPTTPARFLASLWRLLHRHTALLLFVAGTLLVLASVFVLRGGMLHPEVYLYLPHYLSPRPLAERVLDLGRTDANMYSARELSYVFDLLDAKVIAWSVDHLRPHFLSLCHYAFCATAAYLMYYFAVRRLSLPRLGAALLVLLFLTTPAFFLGGGYFRSAKSGVVLALAVCACCVAPAFTRSQTSSRFPWSAWGGTLLAALFMGLFDRQGVFLVILLALALFVQAILAHQRSAWQWLAAPAIALVLLQLYNFHLAPALIESVTGHRPSFEFQRLPWSDLLHQPRVLLDCIFYGPALMLDNLRFLLGSMPAATALGLIALAVWQLGPHWPWPARIVETWTPAQRAVLGRILLASLPLALMAMNALMVLRLKAVVGLDFRRVYYGLPSLAFLWLLLACTIAIWLRISPRRRRTCWLALSAILLCNLLALPEHRHIVRLGLYRDHYRVSPELLVALAHLERVPSHNVKPPYWPTLTSGAPPETDGIVRFFRERQLNGTDRIRAEP